MLNLVTWNINSLRLRLSLLNKVITEMQPDILFLQETKVKNEDFPLEGVKAAGFPYVYFSGQPSYNGVAICSKVPLSNIQSFDMCGMGDARHISGTLPNGIELHNFYVPAGGDIPDVALNPKFDHKLNFVNDMTARFSKRTKKTPLVLVGDLNIAPGEHDVWSHKQLLNVVSHTPVEVEHMARLYASLGWVDTARHFVPSHEKLYSWWSYRNRDWKASNRGRRLDHIWVTPALKDSLKSHSVFKDARDWPSPSDHVPILTRLDI